MNAFKNIWAVAAGFLVVVVLSILTDLILEKTGIFPSIAHGLFITWMLVLALIYRSVYAVVGGYVTASLAVDRPMLLVSILGLIGVLAGIGGVIGGWDKSAHWYPIALVITAYPCTWLGGKLKAKV